MSWQDDPTKPPPPGARPGGGGLLPQVALVIYHRGEASIVPLVPHASIVIGRASEADICVPEPTLSRQHARVEVIGNEVFIEDLESSDGTWVNGKPTIRSKLKPGDDVALGTVTLSLHTTANYARGIEHHARFLVALEEEVTRSRIFGHQLALLLVAPAAEQQQQFAAACGHVRQVLRPVDRVALQAPAVLEVLMPEAGLQEARAGLARLREAIPGLRAALVTYPGAAESAAELLEGGLAALSRARPNGAAEVIGGEADGSRQPSPVTPALRAWGDAMQTVYQTVLRVARSDLPVLIYGETGTGKELVARAIHEAGPRRRRALHCFNCGAIARELIQSTLFGHERGAFTGAAQLKKGVFEAADGGTLLLDEVGELPAEAQVALLRVLETGRLSRVGSNAEIPVDVRVISATHRNLEAMCEAGSFRWDLYYRLNTITIRVPPLRQRCDEIAPLAHHFVERASQLSGLSRPKGIEPPVLELLQRYQWRGNVRELRNVIERAVLVSPGAVIRVEDLPEAVREVAHGAGPEPTHSSRPRVESSSQAEGFKTKVRCFEIRLLRRALDRTSWNKTAAAQQLQMPLRTLMHKVQAFGLRRGSAPTDDTMPVLKAIGPDDENPRPFKAQVREFESDLLVGALEATAWNKAEAARQLRLPLSTMLYKIKTYDLEGPAN